MNQAAAYPFLRILLPLLAGIATGIAANNFLHLHPIWQTATWALTLILLIALLAFRNRKLGAVLAVPLLYCLGVWLWNISDQRNLRSHYLHLPRTGIWKIELLEDAEGKGKYLGAGARVISYTDSTGKTSKASGCIRVMFSRAVNVLPICGNTYFIHGTLQEPKGPALPDAFDYREYLRRKQVYARLRADSGDYRMSGRMKGLRPWAADLARQIELRLARVPDSNRAGLLSSLITGDKKQVAEEDREHFARTGTLHVLAVSGLHVGIIYGILLFLSGRLFRRNHPVQAAIILACVWVYAFLSGLAPSVFRAAFMFSLITLGGVWSSNSKGLNTLAGTAVCMLCIEPRWLMDIGFLLSFSAVAGIMVFYPRLEILWKPGSSILNYLWKMSAVSIAAQLGTLPVTLFCFNSFPLWFLPANLLIIPISTICLVSGLLYLVLGGVPAVGDAVLWICDGLLLILQRTVAVLADLPMHTIEGIYPNAAAVLCLTLLLLMLACYPWIPVKYRLPAMLIIMLGLSAAESQRLWMNRFSRPELIALRWQQGLAVIAAGQQEAVILTSGLRKGQSDTLRKGLERWLRRNGIQKVANIPAEGPASDRMTKGRYFRVLGDGNLCLERVFIHLPYKKRTNAIWIGEVRAGSLRKHKTTDSVNLLNNQQLATGQIQIASSLTGIDFRRVWVPYSGYMKL